MIEKLITNVYIHLALDKTVDYRQKDVLEDSTVYSKLTTCYNKHAMLLEQAKYILSLD